MLASQNSGMYAGVTSLVGIALVGVFIWRWMSEKKKDAKYSPMKDVVLWILAILALASFGGGIYFGMKMGKRSAGLQLGAGGISAY